MKIILALIILSIITTGALAQGGNTGTFRFEERNGTYIAKIVITAKTFLPSQHSLTFADKDYLRRNQISLANGVSLLTKIDGRAPLGTDGTIPRREIASMTVFFNGARLLVPRSLYADCYDPHFEKETFAAK